MWAQRQATCLNQIQVFGIQRLGITQKVPRHENRLTAEIAATREARQAQSLIPNPKSLDSEPEFGNRSSLRKQPEAELDRLRQFGSLIPTACPAHRRRATQG
jgi:hypothetical protein